MRTGARPPGVERPDPRIIGQETGREIGVDAEVVSYLWRHNLVIRSTTFETRGAAWKRSRATTWKPPVRKKRPAKTELGQSFGTNRTETGHQEPRADLPVLN